MKKIFFAVALAVIMMGFNSCGPKQSTPEEAAASLIDAVKDLDVDKAISCIGDEDGNALSDELVDFIKAGYNYGVSIVGDSNVDKVEDQLEKIEYTIKSSKERRDGTYVKVEIMIDGKKGGTQEIGPFNKGNDDKWRLSLPFSESEMASEISRDVSRNLKNILKSSNNSYDDYYDYEESYDDDYYY